ncbi:hypothetical protein [Pontixanthobacter gangjinensis]|uniref:Secreted protein n=1 Tax=Pontixanthobacter gangjinensis TaxID=1028742 RepID=A0A6I4SPA4_9SPHN|nr:hypothetical protein [Pontixanthobacter gangjinensis]MXO56667.1 hypothetical protein [Pontixanthobacter gangjinensis]
MTRFKQFSAGTAFAAALSMSASPVSAAEFPVNSVQSAPVGVVQWDGDAMNAERHRRYRRDRVDAGDVIAGVLILGGIAAVANAASRNNRNDRRYRDQAPNYRQPASNSRAGGGQGIDRAVDMCMREIERDVRVDSVDNVVRNGEGWTVAGTLYNGEGFSCQIDNEGRIGNVSYGQRAASYQSGAYQSVPVEDRQYDNATYAEAWNHVDGDDAPADFAGVEPSGPQPAYPGGPVDGEPEYEEDSLGG